MAKGFNVVAGIEFIAKTTCVLGGAGTGKTQRLVERVAELLNEGAEPNDIIVFTPTPDSSKLFRKRLAALASDGKHDAVAILPVRGFALSILSTEEAHAFTGRNPRLLAPFETNVLMEDIKTSGVRIARLREMLKFFYRGWTELADDDPDWLITKEEELVHEAIKGSLALTRGMIEPEVSSLAFKFLRSNPEAASKRSFAYVIVDDYQTLSFASQAIAGSIVQKELIVSGDPNATSVVYDSFPCVEGLKKLAGQESANVIRLSRCHLPRAATRALNSLLEDPCFIQAHALEKGSESEGSLEVVGFDSPESELRGVARMARNAILDGMDPSDIYVATPNKTWARNVSKALASAGAPVSNVLGPQPLGGDIRDFERCSTARIFTALALVADPENPLAWRSWCAFGDHLASSPTFGKIRKAHAETGMEAFEALSLIADGEGCDIFGETFGEDHVREAFNVGKEIVSRNSGLTGMPLLDSLSRTILGPSCKATPRMLVDLCGPVASDDDAEALYGRAAGRISLPSFAETPDAVKVGPYESVSGLDPKLVILPGFVNGFFPHINFFEDTRFGIDKRQRMHDDNAHLFYNVLGKTNDRMVATCFDEVPLAVAGELSLKVERIRLKEGKRICSISQSEFARYLR